MSDAEEKPIDYLAALRTGAWLDAQTFPPVTWHVPGVIPEGMTVLAGGSKVGKSWLALACALAVASGSKALGTLDAGQPRRVFYLALEDGDRRLQGRIRTLQGDAPIPDRLEYLTRLAHPLAVEQTIDQWLTDAAHDDAAPLVILDTLGKALPPCRMGETTYERDYRIAGRLKQYADDIPGSALLVLHHDRKAHAEDFVQAVSGTTGIPGAADTIALLQRRRHEDSGLLQITGRDITEAEYALRFDAGGWQLDGGTLEDAQARARDVRETVNLGDASAQIVRYVGVHAGGVRAKDVAEALDLTPDNARRYLARLCESGRIDKADRGLYIPVSQTSQVSGSDTATGQQDIRDTSATCVVCEQGLMHQASIDRAICEQCNRAGITA